MKRDALTDRIVLLTGASSGIGWATALELARHRPRIAIAARRGDKLKELAALIEKGDAEALAIPCDISDPAQGHKAVEIVLERWGAVDYLINNAGIMAHEHFHSQHLAEIESLMRTNFLGAASLIQAVLPHMLNRGSGSVLNVASVAGILGIPYMAAYCASKFALVGLTEALRREYYGTGVHFAVICPGTVDTPMAAASIKDEKLSHLLRPKTAEQLAKAITACLLKKSPEVIIGDAPGLLIKLLKLAPKTSDWITHQVVKRFHPLARG